MNKKHISTLFQSIIGAEDADRVRILDSLSKEDLLEVVKLLAADETANDQSLFESFPARVRVLHRR